VPTFNEVGNVPLLVERLLALPLPGLRVLIVDDDSPDGTGDVADKLAEENPGRVTVAPTAPGGKGLAGHLSTHPPEARLALRAGWRAGRRLASLSARP